MEGYRQIKKTFENDPLSIKAFNELRRLQNDLTPSVMPDTIEEAILLDIEGYAEYCQRRERLIPIYLVIIFALKLYYN